MKDDLDAAKGVALGVVLGAGLWSWLFLLIWWAS